MPQPLERRLGFAAATAINVLAMIGVGPFVTIPLLLATMGGPQAMLGWFICAIVALADGLVWAELGALMLGVGTWIVIDGATHGSAAVIVFPPGAWELSRGFWLGLGGATLYATYDYFGYNTICGLGGEVMRPAATIPRSILTAIVIVCLLYFSMSLSIIS